MNKVKAKNILFKSIEGFFVAGYILFEELIWDVFAKPIYQFIKKLIILERLKKIFLGMNRYLLLGVFISILAVAEIMGLASGVMIVNGYILPGIFVYVLKIPIAAFTFWLFELTKQQLMTFAWLKTSYEFIMNLIEKFINSPLHVYIKGRIVAIKAIMKQLSIKYLDLRSYLAGVKTYYLAVKSDIINLFKIRTLRIPFNNKKLTPSKIPRER